MTKVAGSGSIIQKHESAVPDPYQNIMDPQFFLFYSGGNARWDYNLPILLEELSVCLIIVAQRIPYPG